MTQVAKIRERKPDWLKIRPPGGENYLQIKSLLRKHQLHTVCEEAHCPNVAECWGGGTATIMLMGDTCTRACRFCNVKTGNPKGALDLDEPRKVAESIVALDLTYVVLTSVDRDDLPDGGADHFAKTVESIKARNSHILVEVLIPDFSGDGESLKRISTCGADVVAHNIEVVSRLTKKTRDYRCSYPQSLEVLKEIKAYDPSRITKSSIMVGLGETSDEVEQTLRDLRQAKVDIVTLGQYLRPSGWHLPVQSYVEPAQFKKYESLARELGFLYVAAGPLVRSSYRAGELFIEGMLRSKERSQRRTERSEWKSNPSIQV